MPSQAKSQTDLSFGGIEFLGGDKKLFLKGFLVDLKVGEHAQEGLEKRPINDVAVSLLLNQHQDSVHRAGLHELCKGMS